MKILQIITMLLILSTVLVSAKTIEMEQGETWTGEYRKATLTNLNRESAIVCINDQNFIIKKGIRRTFNNIIIELKDISYLTKKATIYLKEDCENCFRDESFFNKKCTTNNEPIIEDKEITNDLEAELIEDIKVNYVLIISLILIAIVLLLILTFLLFRFW